MPYVLLDQHGRISAARVDPQAGWTFVNYHDPRLYDYVRSTPDGRFRRALMAELISSDHDMARMVEDMIDVLVRRGVIRREDIPRQADVKLARRRGLRSLISAFIDEERLPHTVAERRLDPNPPLPAPGLVGRGETG